MSRTYQHLSPEERAVIMIERQNGSSLRAIGLRLGRSAATVSRKLRRCDQAVYNASQAALNYRRRRSRCRPMKRLVAGSRLYQYVHDHLVYRRWSPQQIAAKLRQMPESIRPGLVSHEKIYAAIYAQPRG